MNFPWHGSAARVGGLRQQFIQIFRGGFLRLRVVYAALRVFFFTLVFFLLVLGELRFSLATADLAT